MRPTSVIFLIISILLACVGGMLCLTAVSTAEESGEALFETVKGEDGNYIITKYFGLTDSENPDNASSKNNIKKMAFAFENVDVEIIGGQKDNKIEFYNFTDGMFSYKTSVGGALSVEDLNGLLKMVSFGTSGINFKGFRNLLFYKQYADLDRKVVIYLKDESNVTNISCSVKDGSISVKSLANATDITLSSESGDISIDSLADHSSLNIDVKSGSVSVSNTKLYAIKVNSENAPVELKNCPVQRSLEIKADNADVSYEHMSLNYEGFDVEFKAQNGRLMMNGDVVPNGRFVFKGAPDEDAPETDEEGNPVEAPDENEGVEDGEETKGDSEYTPNSIVITVESGNLTVNAKQYVEQENGDKPAETGDPSESTNEAEENSPAETN